MARASMAGRSGGWRSWLRRFAPFVSLPFDDAAAEHYAPIRHELEVAGQIIGPNDLLIAAICLANDCTLATSNVAEFQRVSGLRVEDWTAALAARIDP